MVSGLYANSNLDDGKNTRQNMLSEIENRHLETINSIYNGNSDEELDFEKDPLFAAIGKSEEQDNLPTTDTTEDLSVDQE